MKKYAISLVLLVSANAFAYPVTMSAAHVSAAHPSAHATAHTMAAPHPTATVRPAAPVRTPSQPETTTPISNPAIRSVLFAPHHAGSNCDKDKKDDCK